MNKLDAQAMLSKILTITGILLLLHSAYSTVHYRTLTSSTTPPLDIVLSLTLSFFLCLAGAIGGMTLKDVRVSGVGSYVGREYDLFNHRQRPKKLR
jgi:hypothetical protein